MLRSGAFVFSVTSADDEMDLAFLDGQYTRSRFAPEVELYSGFSNYFYLVNGGNAVNFLHKAVLGDFSKGSELLGQTIDGHRIHTMFIDSAGIAGPIATRLQELGHRNVIEMNFGAFSPDPKYANMRSYMWGQMKGLAATRRD